MSEFNNEPTRHVILAMETALAGADERVDALERPGDFFEYMRLLSPDLDTQRPVAVLARTDGQGPLVIRERAAAMELFGGQTQVAVRAIQIVGGLRVAMHRIVRFDETQPIYEAAAFDFAEPQDPYRIGVVRYVPSRGEDQLASKTIEGLADRVPGICYDDSPQQIVETIAKLIACDRLSRS